MIRVDDLTFAYTGAKKPAVRNLSFAIETGEVFGFLGPSGAGKSTTQKILIGLLREFSRSVSVFDRDLATWGADYYERVGVSFEFPNHFPETMRMGRSWKRSDPRNSAISSRLVASSSTRSATRKSRGLKECLACTLASGDRHGLHVPSLHDLDEHLANLGVVFQQ